MGVSHECDLSRYPRIRFAHVARGWKVLLLYIVMQGERFSSQCAKVT